MGWVEKCDKNENIPSEIVLTSQNNIFFPYQGTLILISIIMENNESLKRRECNLIFLSPSVPHISSVVCISIIVNISQYFPRLCGQTQSAQSRFSALFPNWKLSGQLQNPFNEMLLLSILHLACLVTMYFNQFAFLADLMSDR